MDAILPVVNKLDALLPALELMDALLPVVNKLDVLLPAPKETDALLPVMDRLDALVPVMDKVDALLPELKKMYALLLVLDELDASVPAMAETDALLSVMELAALFPVLELSLPQLLLLLLLSSYEVTDDITRRLAFHPGPAAGCCTSSYTAILHSSCTLNTQFSSTLCVSEKRDP